MRFTSLNILWFALLVIVAEARADAPEIEFGVRDEARCGDADRAAERVLDDVLGHPQVLARLAHASLFVPRTIDYVQAGTSACRHVRRKARQSRSSYEFRQAQQGNPHGWPKFGVDEYFQLAGGFAHVVLQSSIGFLEQLDEDWPLTTAWPGRAAVVHFLGPEGRRVVSFDSLGRRLDAEDRTGSPTR